MSVLKKVTYMYAENDNLPKDGWIHNCICCDIITGNVYCFSIGYLNKYDMVAYICRRCSIDKKNIIRITNHAPNFINYL
jgi:hypothetical protein